MGFVRVALSYTVSNADQYATESGIRNAIKIATKAGIKDYVVKGDSKNLIINENNVFKGSGATSIDFSETNIVKIPLDGFANRNEENPSLSLKKIILPVSCETIENVAFYDCPLEEFVGNGVKSIGNGGLHIKSDGCKVYLHDKEISYDANAFINTESLIDLELHYQNINIEGWKNKGFKSITLVDDNGNVVTPN